MKDEFDAIHAEREMPIRGGKQPAKYAGLWKQIAAGIVVGHLALGLIGAMTWIIAAQWVGSELRFIVPWAP